MSLEEKVFCEGTHQRSITMNNVTVRYCGLGHFGDLVDCKYKDEVVEFKYGTSEFSVYRCIYRRLG